MSLPSPWRSSSRVLSMSGSVGMLCVTSMLISQNEEFLNNVDLPFNRPEYLGEFNGGIQLLFFNLILRTFNRNDSLNPTIEISWKMIFKHAIKKWSVWIGSVVQWSSVQGNCSPWRRWWSTGYVGSGVSAISNLPNCAPSSFCTRSSVNVCSFRNAEVVSQSQGELYNEMWRQILLLQKENGPLFLLHCNWCGGISILGSKWFP